MSSSQPFQWPTLILLLLCYAVFGLASTVLAEVSLVLAIALLSLSAALHSSLSHEMLHGHPSRNIHVNAALVFPALSFAIPYMRFRDMHLAHHIDERITDPYDDPESCYCDPKVWRSLTAPRQAVLIFCNTLLGRMVLGPLLGQIAFMKADWQLIRNGDRRVLVGWLWHIPAAALPLWWIASFGHLPLWAYFLAVYIGLSILKIRTFLEHQAHEQVDGRTVIIEDRGLLALLFLNNNFHFVHHQHPSVVWYQLPKIYRAQRAKFLAQNCGYRYRSYLDIFRAYFLKPKEPVAHPLWPDHK